MPNYNHTTLLNFRSELKKALSSDPTATNYWPDLELDKLIQQALLNFGGLSGFKKDSIIINTTDSQRLYDIFADSVDEVAAPTITYGDIVSWINIDLIESISVSNPTSSLFTLDELLALIDSKYNIFQLETGLVNRKTTLNVAAQNNLVKLPNDVLDIIRLKYKYTIDSTDYEVIVQREDEDSLASYDAEALTEEGIPSYYSTVFGSPNEILLYPIPNLSGTLEVIFTGTRDLTQVLSVDTVVNLPNNLAPYLKYHCLQDIFNKDGLLNDPARAAYCAKRVAEGMTIGKNYAIALTAKSNGLSIDVDSLNRLDDYTDDVISTNDPPSVVGFAGVNLFEIDTLPSATQNSLLLIINNNMPIPVADTDFIDIEIGYIDPLMNYCVHLAQFKCGAAYLATTNSYLEDFIKTSLSHNMRLINKGISYLNVLEKSKLEEIQYPKIVQE